jgi:hypothetical protein
MALVRLNQICSNVEMLYVDISGRLLTGIAGSNPAGGMDVCRKWCGVRWRSLRLADPSSRGVLPSVVCLSVIRCNITPLHLQ